MTRILFVLIAIIFSSQPLLAESVLLTATKDNTLYENAEGSLSNGAGDHIFTGRTAVNTIRRSLLAFEDLGAIPSGSTITSVRLHLRLTKEDSPATEIDLFRATSDWGEGTSEADPPEGKGIAATAGDATWIHRFFPDIMWSTPGGDHSANSSATAMVDGVADYTVESTASLVADVQQWLDDPDSNFGWIIIGDETRKSARRFASRTNVREENRPILEVEFDGVAIDPTFDFSGPWFDPTLDGEGYLVFKTPAGWLIYYFGYTSDNQRLWLISDVVAPEQLAFGQTIEFTMYVGQPGSFEMPTPSTELTVYGTLLVTVTGCTTADFVLEGTDGVKTSDAILLIGVEGATCVEP